MPAYMYDNMLCVIANNVLTLHTRWLFFKHPTHFQMADRYRNSSLLLNVVGVLGSFTF